MFILLHGTTPPHPVYGSWNFATRATTSKLRVPQVHMIVGNRLTQYEGAAAAFQALSDATADTLYAAFTTHPHYFTKRTNKPKSGQEFRDTYSISLRDFNTAGVVPAHLGSLLSSMKQVYFKVYNTDVKVNANQIKWEAEAVDLLLESLS